MVPTVERRDGSVVRVIKKCRTPTCFLDSVPSSDD